MELRLSASKDGQLIAHWQQPVCSASVHTHMPGVAGALNMGCGVTQEIKWAAARITELSCVALILHLRSTAPFRFSFFEHATWGAGSADIMAVFLWTYGRKKAAKNCFLLSDQVPQLSITVRTKKQLRVQLSQLLLFQVDQ